VTRPRVSLSLRVTLMLVIAGVALYVLIIALYLTAWMRPATERLARQSAPVLYLFGELSDRALGIEEALRLTRRPALTPQARVQTAEQVRSVIGDAGDRSLAEAFASLPSEMRVVLARADDRASRLRNTLVEYAALLELGRLPEATARAHVADSLRGLLRESLASAQRIGLEDLVQRERALSAAANRAVAFLAFWVGLGLVLLPLGLLTVERRVRRPLADLEAGLSRVADGDLNTQLPVTRLDEFGRVITHFNETTRILRDRAQEQGRFAAAGELIAGVAHEVNNPLMAIATLATARLDEVENSEQRAELELIHRQARRAGKLISGLLRFVRPAEHHTTVVEVNDVVREAVDLLSYQFGVDEIEVVQHLDPAILCSVCNPGGLEQVLVNLLSNAIDAVRLTKPPRRIVVESWRKDRTVFVAVEDHGPGIDPAVQARLFRPFASTKGQKGTGLGLYISRQIVREAGGDLTVESIPAAGARFSISLPAALSVATGPLQASPLPAGRATTLAGMDILLVDDEESIRRPLAKYLTRRGATVREASDGIEGIAAINDRLPDAVVADVRMPRMDGVAMYHALTRDHPTACDRVLFLSGDLSQLADLGGTTISAARVLVKPIDLSELDARIRALVSGNSAREAVSGLESGPDPR